MFFIGFGIGFIVGANVALILYAIILVGKDADKSITNDLSSNF